jgi:hypothetical protein
VDGARFGTAANFQRLKAAARVRNRGADIRRDGRKT